MTLKMSIVDRVLPIYQKIYPIYSRFVPLKLQILIRQRIQYFNGYQALPNALEPIEISLDEINHRSQSRFIPERQYIGKIIPGNWDKQKECLHETATYQGLYEHFFEGKPWRETEYYQHAKNNIEISGEFYGYTSPREFLRYRCKYVDELYESIQENTLKKNSREMPYDKNRPWSHYDPTGISVLIGRNGDILLHDGTHRLAIADILGINELPVHVLVRHTKWQQIREKVFQKKEYEGEHTSHPDLQDIL